MKRPAVVRCFTGILFVALCAVAVDAKKNYEEIDVSISKSDMTWEAPYSSEWAVAVGEGDAPQPDDTPPTAPSNLNASAVGKSQIDLSWDEASDGESGINSYKVYRNGDEVGTSDNTSYSDEGLSEGTGYTYRVSAVNGVGLEGDTRYIDRTFVLESVGDLAGMHYIRTANDDKDETGDDFLSFDVSRAVTVHVAYRHGDDLPPWLSSWAKTGDQVCGDGCSDVYKKDFDAGTVTLGGNMPGGAGNMYVVFVAPRGGVTGSFAASEPSTGATPRVRVLSVGALLRVSGLYPQTEYTFTLTDARGRVAGVRERADARGTVALSMVHYSGGVYVLNVRSQRHRCSMITVVP